MAEAVAFTLTLPGASVPYDRPPWLDTTQNDASDLPLTAASTAIEFTPQSSAPKRYFADLTAREVEVLRLLAQRLAYSQIAEKLIITRRTVNGHVTAIYSKLGVNGRAAAMRVAAEHHLGIDL